MKAEQACAVRFMRYFTFKIMRRMRAVISPGTSAIQVRTIDHEGGSS
jgi:hypothetical protein